MSTFVSEPFNAGYSSFGVERVVWAAPGRRRGPKSVGMNQIGAQGQRAGGGAAAIAGAQSPLTGGQGRACCHPSYLQGLDRGHAKVKARRHIRAATCMFLYWARTELRLLLDAKYRQDVGAPIVPRKHRRTLFAFGVLQ